MLKLEAEPHQTLEEVGLEASEIMSKTDKNVKIVFNTAELTFEPGDGAKKISDSMLKELIRTASI